jgi:hypothetical protein
VHTEMIVRPSGRVGFQREGSEELCTLEENSGDSMHFLVFDKP